MPTVDAIFRINEVLSLIHGNLADDLRAGVLAKRAAYSEYYFHRVFKQVTNESVHQYIRRVRLEAAANQLLFSPSLTVEQIAVSCGFLSLSSFTRAFKSTYGNSPGQWRALPPKANKQDKLPFLDDPEIRRAYKRMASKPLPEPDIVNLEPCEVAYIRHKGYGRSIAKPWQQLKNWALTEQRSMDIQIGLHHSNPALMPLAQCHYVACVGIDKPVMRRGKINSVVIPGGLHAAFYLEGQYGDLLPLINKITQQWLPESGFMAKTTPAFARYQENQFLKQDDDFKLIFYLPLQPLWNI